VEHAWPGTSSWCLDNINDNNNNGNGQQIWRCNGDYAQTWGLDSNENFCLSYGGNFYCGYHLHDDYVGGGCLDDTNGGGNGTLTQIWTCKNNVNQLWFNDADAQPGEWENPLGMCMDLINNDQTNGKRIQVWNCNGGAAQTWSFQ